MYDPMSEAHEFIGKDRAEAVAKATAYFAGQATPANVGNCT